MGRLMDACLEDFPWRQELSGRVSSISTTRMCRYKDDDLAQWLARILDRQWTRVFVFFKHEEEARGPELAMRFPGMAAGTLDEPG